MSYNVNWINRLDDAINNRRLERIGAVVTEFANGDKLIDMDVVAKHNRNRNIALAVVFLASAGIGRLLGELYNK